MINFGELRRVPLREIWQHEANDFTPWLAENIEALGEALGLDLELTGKEAAVGDFALDLLAKDLTSSRTVIIENQLSQTNHDHLGKLLTYSAGFDASTAIWLSEEIRDEHRQAMEWLNQKTGIDTQFFAVVVEVLKIDNSDPAFNFKLIVSPNEWQKLERQKVSTNTSPKLEKYRSYYQHLVDELRERHDFTRASASQAQNWYAFASGFRRIRYYVSFVRGSKVYAAVRMERELQDENEKVFDALEQRRTEIDAKFGNRLEWDRGDQRISSQISIYRDGTLRLPIVNWNKSESGTLRTC